MTLARGRVLRMGDAGELVPIPARGGAAEAASARRLSAAERAARERAARILARAEGASAALVADAQQKAAVIAEEARADGLARGFAEILSGAVARRLAKIHSEEDARDHTVALASLIAERLLGHALRADPAEIASIARQVLAEARGARRIVVRASPEDTAVLAAVAAELDPDGRVSEVSPDPALARGDLRLETDIGTVEARLGDGTARLAARLREVLP